MRPALLAVLLAGAAGCGQQTTPIPSVEQVERTRPSEAPGRGHPADRPRTFWPPPEPLPTYTPEPHHPPTFVIGRSRWVLETDDARRPSDARAAPIQGTDVVVTRAPSRAEVWVEHRGTDPFFEHAKLVGTPLPPRMLLLHAKGFPADFDWEPPTWVISSPNGGFAYVLSGDGSFASTDAVPLERAPVTGDTDLDDRSALLATASVRWLQTCPASRRSCLLYGTPADVEAAVDPEQPPGDWYLRRRPNRGKWARIAPLIEPEGAAGLRTAPLADPIDPPKETTSQAWARVGGRDVRVFDFTTTALPVGGLERHEGRLVAWFLDPWASELTTAVLDASTGERVGPALTVRADPYHDVQCGNVYAETRPLPVWLGDRLGYAITWAGSPEAILFEGDSERGRLVSARIPLADHDDGRPAEAADLDPLLAYRADCDCVVPARDVAP